MTGTLPETALLLLAIAMACALGFRYLVPKGRALGSLGAGVLTCVLFCGANTIRVGYFDPFLVLTLPVLFLAGFFLGLLLRKRPQQVVEEGEKREQDAARSTRG